MEHTNQEEEVNSTANNNQSESSSFSISTTNSYNSRVVETSEGESNYIPEVEENLIPVQGSVFESLDEGIKMYEKYAYESGFETRLSTQRKSRSGTVVHKYILCNKAGIPQDITIDTLNSSEKKERISSTKITGCKAQAVFRIVEGTNYYKLDHFEERHNHQMNAIEHIHLSRKHRKLGFSEMNFIQKVSTSNIGPTKAHHIYSNIQGSHRNTHGTVDDFKNLKMSINRFIGSDDSQMLINKMENRRECVAGFSFEFKVENNELAGLFWADEIAKGNFKEFGDIISFDATYRTNKYNMIFVPFTGIDNHKKTVSIGAGMVINETADSYEWLLRAFLKAFGNQPKMIVTDQDVSMKKAIEIVFPESRHRLCMWHITQKLPSKVGKSMFDNTDFKKKFNQIVWNLSITSEKFEKKWKEIMKEFNLEKNEWFTHMYNIRTTWIPAFFTDIPMSGLMRTTSRSESENSFFSNFTNNGSTLVHFMMSYESAMERQGSRLEILDHQSHNKRPAFLTPLMIERQACKVYTRTIFLLVQREIQLSIWNCSQVSVIQEEKKGCDVIIIREKREINKNRGDAVQEERRKKKKDNDEDEVVEDILTVDAEEVSEDGNEKSNAASTSGTQLSKRIYTFKVTHDKEEETIVCSCMTFARYGFLCRHIFCMFKANDIEQIPEKYILRRWRKDLVPPGMRTRRTRYGESSEECERLGNELHFIVENCVSILGNNEEKLSEFVEKVRGLKDEIEDEFTNFRSKKTDEIIESFLGVSKPDENNDNVQNPATVRFKGCGKDSRLKSLKETAIQEYIKPKRKCAKCGKMTNHDKRNCEKKREEREKTKTLAEALKGLKKK